MFLSAKWVVVNAIKITQEVVNGTSLGRIKSQNNQAPKSSFKTVISRKAHNSLSITHGSGGFSSLLVAKFCTNNEIFWNLQTETTKSIY